MPADHPIPTGDFQLFFEKGPFSCLVLAPDPDFTILGVTDNYLRDTLRRREDVVGKPVFSVFPDNPHTPDAHSTRNLGASLRRVVETRSVDEMPVQRYDVPNQDRTGFEVRYWSPVNTPVLSAAGELIYIIHRVTNVTDYMRMVVEHDLRQRESIELNAQNRRMESELLQQSVELDAKNRELQSANGELTRYASKMREEAQGKDEFLAMLAHELRNPLAGISSALELLGIVGSDAPQAVQLREVCDRQLGNLTRLVDDLLDASRVSRGEVRIRNEPVDLRDVVQSALQGMRGVLDKRRLALHTRLAAGSFSMTGDATRLEQVLANLLANAAKYTDDDGEVEVALDTEEKNGRLWAVLQVRDTGRGIPPEKLPSIFGMFVQVDPSIDRAKGGLGIGLTLVQKLVELHGGAVVAQSQGAGRGSTFTVRLPLDASVSVPAPALRSSTTPAVSTSVGRILIIEDNDDARETLKTLLEAHGYTVQVAETGEVGLALLLDSPPDLAIVDLGLPGLDGFQVAERVRAAPEGAAVKLVALSGYGGADTERKAFLAGFDRHFVKPVTVSQLAAVIETTVPDGPTSLGKS